MKELSVEEKAKRYDEAINSCREFYETLGNPKLKEEVEEIFPKLKESEDERVKEELKEVLGECLNVRPQIVEEKQYIRFIAWLEKRGEKGTKGNEREIPIPEPPLTINHAKEVMGIKQDDAWSEEDEQYLLICKNALAKYQTTDKWDASIISHWLENKLKSLKERYTWKPTMEQLTVLSNAIELRPLYESDGTILMSLYYDLKKLTE